jgi:hypothetical protein
MLENFNLFFSATLGIGSGLIVSIFFLAIFSLIFNKFYK